MFTIGQFLIEYLCKDEWRISYHIGSGRRYVRIQGLENEIEKIVQNKLFQIDELIKIFECFLLNNIDTFLNNYSDFIKYLPDENNIDYLKETREEKFNRHLLTFIHAYNAKFNSSITRDEVEEHVIYLRREYIK